MPKAILISADDKTLSKLLNEFNIKILDDLEEEESGKNGRNELD